MKPAIDLPDDPALPGVGAIRALGLARAIPALGLDGRGIELALRGYTPGSRATIAACAGNRRFVVKAYAADPASEAEAYRALAAGLGGDSGARVPPLLVCDHDFRVLVIGWLDGATTHELLKTGQGERAGELGARWLERAFSLPVPLGQQLGAGYVLCEAGRSVTELVAADPTLRVAASAVGEALADSQPSDGVPRLVHGALYDRHVLDQDDAVGVIDWRHFGRAAGTRRRHVLGHGDANRAARRGRGAGGGERSSGVSGRDAAVLGRRRPGLVPGSGVAASRPASAEAAQGRLARAGSGAPGRSRPAAEVDPRRFL